MNKNLLKYLSFGLLMVLVAILITGSVLEKLIGTAKVYEHIYTSPVTLLCWGVMTVCALGYLWKQKMQNIKVTFALHLSFVLILVGALVTHFGGVQGTIHLRQGEEAVHVFELNNHEKAELPFGVSLKDFELEYYAGTFSPMDYVSNLCFVSADGEKQEGKVSMNHIFEYQHYRFYQSGYDRDGEGTVLAISYDPYGILLTYIGYASLLLSMIGFFWQKKTRFRALLRHPALIRMGVVGMCLLVLGMGTPAQAAAASATTETSATTAPRASATRVKRPQVLPKRVAAAFGDLYIYYNDRICPIQTVARDFTIKLYGKSSYRGMNAEQVLSGWFFFYDSWKEQPMIRIKDKETRQLLGIEGEYASITDFVNEHGYKLQKRLEEQPSEGVRMANEKFNLISMASTGSLFKIYPYRLPEDHVSVWYSFADQTPRSIPGEEWGFIRNSMSYVAEKIAMRDYQEVIRLLGKIKLYQEKRGDDLPSKTKFQAEKWYNTTNMNRPMAMACVTIGILTFGLFCRMLVRRTKARRLTIGLQLLMGLVSLYLLVHLSLRG